MLVFYSAGLCTITMNELNIPPNPDGTNFLWQINLNKIYLDLK